eukprot:6464532-Amphidinium_carterae.1
MPYTLSEHVRDLGYDLTFRGADAHDTSEERVDAAVGACDRMEKLGLAKAVAEQAVQTAILAKALWGTEFVALPETLLHKLSSAVRRAIGAKHGQRNLFVSTVLTSRHIIHPSAC